MLAQLPALDDERGIDAASIARFQEDGHVLIRGVASEEEVEAWRPVIRDVAMAHSTEERPLEDRDTRGKAFLQISNIWPHDERVQRFVFAARFARIAADLLGVDALRIYHDQAIFKEPGAALTPMHQDQYYFPLDGDEIITMWLPLVPVSEVNGSMYFGSGSHRHGCLSLHDVSDESESTLRSALVDRDLPIVSHGALAPGDATFHSGWTVHGAPANGSDAMREVMTIIWFADGLRGIEPEHDWHVTDYERWLPGVGPGDLAASPLNPLVWQRS